jgi:cyanophycin synthetase
MKQGRIEWFTRGSRTSIQSSVGKTIADQKNLTKLALQRHHIPTAKSVLVKNTEDIDQLDQLTYPVVMKPLDGRHGQGVYVGLNDKSQALAAYQKCQNSNVLFEETLAGTEYRIICVDYTFVAAAFRKPAFVVGDGQQTIEQLVAEKNKHPWRGEGHTSNLTKILIDDIVQENLAFQHLSPTSVPAAGQEIVLRKTANLSTGGEAWNVTNEVSQANRELFEKIARACDLRIIGIDVMCQSLQTPIVDQSQAGIIEVNASPGLRMHHYPVKGDPINVAKLILSMTLHHLSS